MRRGPYGFHLLRWSLQLRELPEGAAVMTLHVRAVWYIGACETANYENSATGIQEQCRAPDAYGVYFLDADGQPVHVIDRDTLAEAEAELQTEQAMSAERERLRLEAHAVNPMLCSSECGFCQR
jgi:hypothetical protein